MLLAIPVFTLLAAVAVFFGYVSVTEGGWVGRAAVALVVAVLVVAVVH